MIQYMDKVGPIVPCVMFFVIIGLFVFAIVGIQIYLSKIRIREEVEGYKSRKYCHRCGGRMAVGLTPSYFNPDSGILAINTLSFYCTACSESIWDAEVSVKYGTKVQDVMKNWEDVLEEYINDNCF